MTKVTKPAVRETKPAVRETKPVVRDAKPVVRDVKPVIREAKPKPEPVKPQATKPVDPPKKIAEPAKKLEPIKKTGDVTKVVPKLDPAKKTGDLAKNTPANLPAKPGTAGPGGPVPPGQATNVPPGTRVPGSSANLPIGTKTPALPGGLPNQGPIANQGQRPTVPNSPVGLPGQKTAAPITPQTYPGIRQTLLPAKGVNIKPMLPPTIPSSRAMIWKPAPPPVPLPRLAGPAWLLPAPRFTWYPWGGRRYFPTIIVGAIVTGVVVVTAREYWRTPTPSCYAGGSTVYYYPGTRVCYDFAVAREDDEFECHGKVFRYRPSRYRTVETMIENEAPTAVPVATWTQTTQANPERRVQVQAAIDRAAARAQTVAAAPPETLDCTACLAALGPTDGEDGQSTVSMVNNCDHAITVVGGLTKTGAPADTPAVCEFQGDVPPGEEVVACTKPTSDFSEAQVFLNAVVPAQGTAKAAPACRIPDAKPN